MTVPESETSTNISEKQWQTLEKLLPAGADPTHVRAKLDQIRRERLLPPHKLAKECEKAARAYDAAIAALRKVEPNKERAESIERIARDSQYEKRQAELLRRIRKVKQPHFTQQCQILFLWEYSGGAVPIHTKGPHIEFFRTASEAVFEKSPDAAQIKDIVGKYRHLNFSAATMWGTGAVLIDDSKVGILHAGGSIEWGGQSP